MINKILNGLAILIVTLTSFVLLITIAHAVYLGDRGWIVFLLLVTLIWALNRIIKIID